MNFPFGQSQFLDRCSHCGVNNNLKCLGSVQTKKGLSGAAADFFAPRSAVCTMGNTVAPRVYTPTTANKQQQQQPDALVLYSATGGAYRRVIDTSDVSQLVEMELRPGAVLPGEVHASADQTFFVYAGSGQARVRAPGEAPVVCVELRPTDILRVRHGWWHEVQAGAGGLHLATLYAPPVHAPGTYQREQPADGD